MAIGRPRLVDLDELERLWKAGEGRKTAAGIAAELSAATGRKISRDAVTDGLQALAADGRIDRPAGGRSRDTYVTRLRRNAAHKLAPGESRRPEFSYLNVLSRHEEGLPIGQTMGKMLAAAQGMAAEMRARRAVWDVSSQGTLIQRPAKPHELTPDGDLVSLVVQSPPGTEGQA